MKCFKIQALGHKVGFIAICQASFRFPLTKARRIWFGVDVTVNAISLSRKLKRTSPTPTQQNRVTGMWSGEDKLRSPVPPLWPSSSHANTPRAGSSWGATHPTVRAAQQMWKHPAPTAPKMHPWVWDQQPGCQRPSLWAQGRWHMWIILLPSFWVIPSLPRNHCPSAFPLHPSPTRTTSWVALLSPF